MGALGYGCYMSNEPATVFAFPPSNHPIISVKPRPTKVRGLSPKVPAKATMTVLKTTIMEKTSAREAKKTNVAMRRATTSTGALGLFGTSLSSSAAATAIIGGKIYLIAKILVGKI